MNLVYKNWKWSIRNLVVSIISLFVGFWILSLKINPIWGTPITLEPVGGMVCIVNGIVLLIPDKKKVNKK